MRKHCRNFLDLSMRNAARVIRQSSQTRFFAANEGKPMSTNIRGVVQEKYGEAALRVLSGGSCSCGATANCRSAADLTLDPALPTMRLDNVSGDVQSQPGSGNPVGILGHPIVSFE